MGAETHGLVFAVAGGKGLHFNRLHMIQGIDHGDINVLAVAGAVPVQQGIAEGAKGTDSGYAVSYGHADKNAAARPGRPSCA